MSNVVYNASDLSALGLVTRGVAGVHDLIPAVVSRQFVPGSSMPHDTTVRDSDIGRLIFTCVVAGEDHAELVSKLRAIKRVANPRIGWKHLSITDLSGLRTLAGGGG